MPSRSLMAAVALLTGSLLVVTSAHILGQQRRSDAEWLLTRAKAEASAYPETFEGKHLDAALVIFKDRRAKMATVLRYDLLRALGGVGAGAGILWLYVLFLFSRFKPIEGRGSVSVAEERGELRSSGLVAGTR